MLAVYLVDVHLKAEDPLPTERAERLAARAQEWSREAAALAEAIERALTNNLPTSTREVIHSGAPGVAKDRQHARQFRAPGRPGR